MRVLLWLRRCLLLLLLLLLWGLAVVHCSRSRHATRSQLLLFGSFKRCTDGCRGWLHCSSRHTSHPRSTNTCSSLACCRCCITTTTTASSRSAVGSAAWFVGNELFPDTIRQIEPLVVHLLKDLPLLLDLLCIVR